MICEKCNTDRLEKDFLGKQFCYKCVWKEKTQKNTVKQKVKKCIICDELLSTAQWKYCGIECSKKGHSKMRWHHKVNAEKIKFNKMDAGKRL